MKTTEMIMAIITIITEAITRMMMIMMMRRRRRRRRRGGGRGEGDRTVAKMMRVLNKANRCHYHIIALPP